MLKNGKLLKKVLKKVRSAQKSTQKSNFTKKKYSKKWIAQKSKCIEKGKIHWFSYTNWNKKTNLIDNIWRKLEMRNEAKTNFSSECDVLFLKLLDFETFQFLGFCIEKIWYPKKYRIPYQKIWYRKKFWIQFRSDLGYFGWSLRFKNSMFWNFSIFFMIWDSVLKNLVLKKKDIGFGINKIGY